MESWPRPGDHSTKARCAYGQCASRRCAVRRLRTNSFPGPSSRQRDEENRERSLSRRRWKETTTKVKKEAGAGICSRLPRRTGARCWHLREGCPIRGENAGQGARGQRSSTVALTTAGHTDRLQQKHRLRLQSAGGASDTEQSSAAREQRRPASGEHVSQSAVRRRLPSWQLLVAQHHELPITPSAAIGCCSWHAAAMHQPTSGQHWVPCGCMLPLPAPPYRPRLARRDRRLRKHVWNKSTSERTTFRTCEGNERKRIHHGEQA